MIIFLNSKIIYRGFNSLEFNRIRETLAENGIEYRARVLSYGTFAQSADPTEYRIFIRKKDIYKAELLQLI